MNSTDLHGDTARVREYSNARIADVDINKAFSAASKIVSEIEKVIIGKHREVTLLVTAMLAGSHVLIEDVPGVGKTTLASALAAAAGLDFRRAQFTPDITASDITGFNIYNRSLEKFEFVPGLVMTNVLLADEINRASPRTQSALLEVMEEGRVTVDGKTYEIPEPFFVVATQNPSGFVGTSPLPEAQLDRFGLKLSMGYPTLEEEIRIVESRDTIHPQNIIKPVCSAPVIGFLRALTADVHIDEQIFRYMVTLVSATRDHRMISLGASPRASIALKRLCQAYAFMNGRSYVIPEDAAELFVAAVSHRIILTGDAKVKKVAPEWVLGDILSHVKVPYKGKH